MCVCMCVCVCACVRACVRVCVRAGGYLLISIAEIRYRHDLVRLCHKFYFCAFRMKISHIDEDRAVCVTYPGLCLGFFVLGFGGSRSKKIFGATQRRENFLGLVGGPGACSPENFEKIMFRIGRNRISGH